MTYHPKPNRGDKPHGNTLATIKFREAFQAYVTKVGQKSELLAMLGKCNEEKTKEHLLGQVLKYTIFISEVGDCLCIDALQASSVKELS